MLAKAMNLNQLCRLCLKKEDAAEAVDIIQRNLAMRIVSCVSVEITPDDALPKQVCKTCYYQLEKTHLFRAKSKEAEAKLKKHIRLVHAGKKSSLFNDDDDDGDFEEEHAQSIEVICSFESAQKDEILAGFSVEREQINQRHKKFIHELVESHKKSLEKAKESSDQSWKSRLQTLQATFDKERNFLQATHNEEIARLQNEQKAFADRTRNQIRNEEIGYIFDEAKRYFLARCGEASSPIVTQPGTKSEKYQTDDEDLLISQQPNTQQYSTQQYLDEGDGEPSGETEVHPIFDDTEAENEDYELGELEENEKIDDGVGFEEMLEPTSYEVLINSEDFEPAESASLKQKGRNKRKRGDDQHFVIVKDSIQSPAAKKSQQTYEIASLKSESSKDDGESEKQNYDFDYGAMERAVQLTLTKSGTYNADMPISLKYKQLMNDVVSVEVSNNGSTTIMEFQSSEIQQSSDGGGFVCSTCAEVFALANDLKQHENDVHTPKGLECQYCSRWCPTKSALARHTRIHTGEKPFKCEECGKQFIQKEILKRHITTHTGLRPYKCVVAGCDQRFIQKDLLKQHVNRKHSENPVYEIFKCYLCPKTFCHSSGLSRHLATHTGKKFVCDICQRKFTDSSALKRHKNTIHAAQTNKTVKTEG